MKEFQSTGIENAGSDEENGTNLQTVGETNVTQPTKKRKLVHPQEISKAVPSTGLVAYLQNNFDGKQLIGLYKKANFKFDKNVRSKLVRLVINREKELFYKENPETAKFTISRERFLKLAGEICEVFPGENVNTYYIPFCKKQGGFTPTSGKLYDTYTNVKKILREKRASDSDVNGTSMETFHENGEEEQKLEWLKYNTEPSSQIKAYWNDTFSLRRTKLLSSQLSVHDYIKEFACLKFQDGAELLKNDFQRLYPEAKLHHDEWKIIKSILIEELAKVKTSITVEEKAWVFLLPTLDDEKQDALIFYLLPLVITSRRQGKKGKKKNELADTAEEVRKLSNIERRESFIVHVQNASDLDRTIEELQQKLRKKKETLQPLPIVVGDLNNIQATYVLINSIKYMVTSCLDAFDLAFKAAFALDTKWPSEANTLWLFVQQILYKIHLAEDLNSQSLNVIIGYINNELNKTQIV